MKKLLLLLCISGCTGTTTNDDVIRDFLGKDEHPKIIIKKLDSEGRALITRVGTQHNVYCKLTWGKQGEVWEVDSRLNPVKRIDPVITEERE